jgi:hypothetical protein
MLSGTYRIDSNEVAKTTHRLAFRGHRFQPDRTDKPFGGHPTHLGKHLSTLNLANPIPIGEKSQNYQGFQGTLAIPERMPEYYLMVM